MIYIYVDKEYVDNLIFIIIIFKLEYVIILIEVDCINWFL